MKRNFSVVARYPLKFTRCSLLVLKSLVSLQNLLVTRCRSCSLQKITHCFVVKFARYSLQKLLIAKNHSLFRCKICSLLVAEIARCKKSLATHCEIRSLLVAEIARFKKSLVFRFKIPSVLIATNHSLLKQSPGGIIVCLKSTKLGGSFRFFNIICLLRPKNSKLLKSICYHEICCYQNIV